MEIDTHLGCAMSGLVADARTMIEHARVETQVKKKKKKNFFSKSKLSVFFSITDLHIMNL